MAYGQIPQPKATGAGLLSRFAKRLAVLGVPIHGEAALLAQGSVQGVGEVATDLHHPGMGGTGGAAGQLYAT